MSFYFATDPNLVALNNGLAPPHAEGAHLSEHQAGDKVKLGRADQGDDAGTTFSFARTMNLTGFLRDVCLIFSIQIKCVSSR